MTSTANQPVVLVTIAVTSNSVTLKKSFEHGIPPGNDVKNIPMNDRLWTREHDNAQVEFPWLSIPRHARVSLSFTLLNTWQATKIEIFDPYINLYHC